MHNPMGHRAQLVLALAMLVFGSTARGQSEISQEDVAFFENQVRPILADHCTKCHGRERQEGNLRLDTPEGLLAGGDSGLAITPGEVDDSQLISAVRYEEYEMPPSGQLPAAKILVLEDWVSRGAPWPSHSDEGGLDLRGARDIDDEDRNYWAFRPLANTPPPQLNSLQSARVQTPIDAFVIDRLAEQGLSLADPAQERTLMRRLYFDLVGVPPTQQESEQFLSDPSPTAYEDLVDRLLDDPRYGEKWARHWLDLVRYAETDGFNQDADRPTAFLYRDWVISALNRDMPYDDFVAAQLAGDELAPDDPEMLAATGYLRNWIYEYNQRDVRTQWENVLNDITDVTSEVFFGLGLGCARCHDHKFDPLLQKDYFRLRASFAAFLPRDDRLYATAEQLSEYRAGLEKWEAATEAVRRELASFEDPIRKSIAEAALNKFPLDVRPVLFKPEVERDGHERQLADFAHRQVLEEWNKLDFAAKLKEPARARWTELQAELKKFEALRPQEPPRLLSAGEVETVPPPMFIPPDTTHEPVPPARFEVFGGNELLGPHEVDMDLAASEPPASSGRRTRLAQWINSPENPLPHRVIVNRIWQYHFGNGIVRNASDFGRLGAPPTHPELLDWMASWFLDNGRSQKKLQRLIVTSSVYRQSSQPSQQATQRSLAIDMQNDLLWRFPSRRLDAEQIRDAMLVAAGCMSGKRGGSAEDHDSYCRSVYTLVKRNKPHPFLTSFDAPDGSGSVGRRQTTTTPNQSLLLANAPWPLQLAGEMAERLVQDQGPPRGDVIAACQRCFQRPPNDRELALGIEFLRTTTRELLHSGEFAKSDGSDGVSPAASATGTNALDSQEAGEAQAERLAQEARNRQQIKWYETAAYQAALTDYCHVLFNSSEFLYVE